MRANTELPLITLTESRDSVGERERFRAGSAVLSNLTTSPFRAVTSSAILHRGRQSHLCMEKSEGHLFLISFSLHSLTWLCAVLWQEIRTHFRERINAAEEFSSCTFSNRLSIECVTYMLGYLRN